MYQFYRSQVIQICGDDKFWSETKDLQVGDSIRKADGSTGDVESVATEQISQEMYTLAGTAQPHR